MEEKVNNSSRLLVLNNNMGGHVMIAVPLVFGINNLISLLKINNLKHVVLVVFM